MKILKHLKKGGISQKQLAEMVNVSPQQINKIVKGSENLTLETISKIEDALGIKLLDVNSFEQTVPYELPNNIELERNKKIIKFVGKTQNIDSGFSQNYSQDNLSA